MQPTQREFFDAMSDAFGDRGVFFKERTWAPSGAFVWREVDGLHWATVHRYRGDAWRVCVDRGSYMAAPPRVFRALGVTPPHDRTIRRSDKAEISVHVTELPAVARWLASAWPLVGVPCPGSYPEIGDYWWSTAGAAADEAARISRPV